MAAFRGVLSPALFGIVLHLILLDYLTAQEVKNAKCDKPWYISVTEELVVSWTGEDRDATVTANITTKDIYGRTCDSNESLKDKFKARSLKLNNPCSNALYFVTVTLVCSSVSQRQNLTIRTPPDAPTIIHMKPTNSSIEIRWSSPPGKIHLYKVILEGGRTYKRSRELETVDTSGAFAGLEPYTEYNATVSAKNEDHWSKKSTVKSVRTLQGVPFAPENLEATEVTSDSISFKWDDQEEEIGPILKYDIYWIENGTTGGNTESSKTTSYHIKSLFPYTMYHIEVVAINSVGASPSSNLDVLTKLAVPDPPEIHVTSITNTSISLVWKMSKYYRGPAPRYSLRWKVQNRDDQYDTADVKEASKESQFTITKLMPFTTYEVRIRAQNDAGLGRWSNILNARTFTGIPSVPKNLKVDLISAFDVTVSWEVPNPPNGIIRNYMVAWRTKPKHSKTDYTDTTFFKATDLSPYTDYDFKVCASTEAGWSNWTPVLKVKTDVSVPSEPLNLTESEVTNTSIQIEWLSPEHENGPYVTYVIRWMATDDYSDDYDYYSNESENVTMNPNSFTKDEVNTTTYEIQNLKPYTNYSIQVCAKTSAGLGNYTDPLFIKTIAGIPTSPTAVEAASVQSTNLTLKWSAPEYSNGPLKGYVVHWGVKGTGGSTVRTPFTDYRALGLRPYTEYFFMVAAVTEGGKGPYNLMYRRTGISTPSVPRDLISSSVSDHFILLKWSVPEHPSGPSVKYTVKWHKISDESSIQVHDTNDTIYRIHELAPETNYFIQVRASTDAGEGPWTEILQIRTKEKDHSSAIITGSVVGGFLVLFVIACIILLLFAKRRGGLKNIISSKPTAKSTDTLQTTISLPLEVISDSSKIRVADFDDYLLKLMSNGYYKLGQEFEKLGRESPAYSSDEAKKNDNLTKNRWVKILPFDHSRVKLRSIGDEVEPDFINASYVPGDSYILEYIATQGPLSNTVNDFWRMVWQESVFLMVMLAQCVERAKRTCERYWPAAGTSNKYGDLEVHTISESITPAYIQRLFLLSQDGKQRHVVHLHYMNWPVSGCPKSPDDFLNFVRTVRGQVSCGVTGPMLVHCSAGIGRTGTFIAVDRLSQAMTRQCQEVDVYGTVLEMRRYRANLVQTEEQYYFIHLCLQRIIQEKRQELEDEYGRGIYSN